MHNLTTSIDYRALLAAIFAGFLVGGIWFSPPVFLNPWMKIARVSKTQMDQGIGFALLVDFVSLSIMSFMMAQALHLAGAKTLEEGLIVSFALWLGFVATVQIGVVTYEHKPFRFYVMICGYRLVTMLLMGGILTVWG